MQPISIPMKIKKIFCVAAATFTFQLPAFATEPCNFINESAAATCQHVVRPYQKGSWDVYLTGYAWHAGATFSGKKLNAQSYGGGFGKHWTDENGHEDLLYTFVFLDSYKHVQPIAGYARIWFTKPIGQMSVGGGLSIGLTGRADMLRYIPLPFILPVGTVRFNKFSLMGSMIPRKRGAVGLIWARYQF